MSTFEYVKTLGKNAESIFRPLNLLNLIQRMKRTKRLLRLMPGLLCSRISDKISSQFWLSHEGSHLVMSQTFEAWRNAQFSLNVLAVHLDLILLDSSSSQFLTLWHTIQCSNVWLMWDPT